MDKALNQRVMVALDVENRETALDLAGKLADSGCWLKVGLELYTRSGPGIIEDIKQLGFPIFLDLKLHDIPTTVERTVRGLAGLGCDMLNVHCSGGYDMMARAAEAAKETGAKNGFIPKIIGVTVLTSMNQIQLKEEVGVNRQLEEQVLSLALLAQRAGLDGVVASAQEAKTLRQSCGKDFRLVTPGIRPLWSEHNDQARVLSPKEALDMGSSYLVIGRPINRASDPRQALEKIWDSEY